VQPQEIKSEYSGVLLSITDKDSLSSVSLQYCYSLIHQLFNIINRFCRFLWL